VSWVSQSLYTYGSLDAIGSLLITLLFIILISMPYALVGFYHKPIQNNKLFNANLFALLFLLVELIKSWIFGGFPWLLVGYSQSETIFNYIYPIFGSYAVTYFVILISAILIKSFLYKSKEGISFIIIFILLYYLFPPYLSDVDYDGKKTISFTIYQPNIYPQESYNVDEYENIRNKYLNFLNKKNDSDIVIFPETIVPYELQKNDPLYRKITEFTSKEKILITGLFTIDGNKVFNSMVFFSDQVQIYNKRKLVPFGEYTPWYNTFIKLAESLDIPLSNIAHGFDNQKDINFKDIKIVPIICFESTFSNLINSNMPEEVIINVSNDSWFGKSLAPYQHLQISQIRALEFNRSLLRATNTGISAVINNNGQVIDHIPNDVEGIISGKISINKERSIYSQYGDMSILMLLFLTLLVNGLVRLKKML
tara:strand:- start:5590 stop:6861 length:1272 start_codon:yes stop_codon:yes gene_type:complete